jgi:hypothetical protein
MNDVQMGGRLRRQKCAWPAFLPFLCVFAPASGYFVEQNATIYNTRPSAHNPLMYQIPQTRNKDKKTAEQFP